MKQEGLGSSVEEERINDAQYVTRFVVGKGIL